MAVLSLTRSHGVGCGSLRSTRKTKARGRLTTPIRPSVEVTPTRATDQKSATISEIQRSHIVQRSRLGSPSRCRPCNAVRSEGRRSRSAAAWCPDLVDERGCDPTPDHALARHLDDCGGIAAGRPGVACAHAGWPPGPAFEIADDGRQFEEPARQGERVGGDDVEPGQPRSIVLFAPLGDDVAEHVELVEHRVEPQTDDRKTALRLIRRCNGL